MIVAMGRWVPRASYCLPVCLPLIHGQTSLPVPPYMGCTRKLWDGEDQNHGCEPEEEDDARETELYAVSRHTSRMWPAI